MGEGEKFGKKSRHKPWGKFKLKLHIVSDDQLIAFAKFKDAQGAIASSLVFHF
jgi:hypothetical protein